MALPLLHDDARVTLFADPAKFDADVLRASGPRGHSAPGRGFLPRLARAAGPVRVDRDTAPSCCRRRLTEAGIAVAWGDDPCRLPKARKNAAEIAGTREAHLRDGAAMVEFLCWLDAEPPKGGLTEIAVVHGAGRVPAGDQCAA